MVALLESQNKNHPDLINLESKGPVMQILVHKDRSISEIREEFNLAFPYLSLEFFTKTHTAGQSGLITQKNQGRKLCELTGIETEKNIIITPATTVEKLEKQFSFIYKLQIHVMRKSGNAWLQTLLTNHWSLEQQNQEGENLNNLAD
jgi:hypothetical protein